MPERYVPATQNNQGKANILRMRSARLQEIEEADDVMRDLATPAADVTATSMVNHIEVYPLEIQNRFYVAPGLVGLIMQAAPSNFHSSLLSLSKPRSERP